MDGIWLYIRELSVPNKKNWIKNEGQQSDDKLIISI